MVPANSTVSSSPTMVRGRLGRRASSHAPAEMANTVNSAALKANSAAAARVWRINSAAPAVWMAQAISSAGPKWCGKNCSGSSPEPSSHASCGTSIVTRSGSV